VRLLIPALALESCISRQKPLQMLDGGSSLLPLPRLLTDPPDINFRRPTSTFGSDTERITLSSTGVGRAAAL
jgi:hypothetical protein